jgi:hypothetical protein
MYEGDAASVDTASDPTPIVTVIVGAVGYVAVIVVPEVAPENVGPEAGAHTYVLAFAAEPETLHLRPKVLTEPLVAVTGLSNVKVIGDAEGFTLFEPVLSAVAPSQSWQDVRSLNAAEPPNVSERVAVENRTSSPD